MPKHAFSVIPAHLCSDFRSLYLLIHLHGMKFIWAQRRQVLNLIHLIAIFILTHEIRLLLCSLFSIIICLRLSIHVR